MRGRYKTKSKNNIFIFKYLYFVLNIIVALIMFFSEEHFIIIFGIILTNELYAIIMFCAAILYLIPKNKYVNLLVTSPFLLHISFIIQKIFEKSEQREVVAILIFTYILIVLITIENECYE